MVTNDDDSPFCPNCGEGCSCVELALCICPCSECDCEECECEECNCVFGEVKEIDSK